MAEASNGVSEESVRAAERERCAKLAEQGGKDLQEPAVGHYIAKLIRQQ